MNRRASVTMLVLVRVRVERETNWREIGKVQLSGLGDKDGGGDVKAKGE